MEASARQTVAAAKGGLKVSTPRAPKPKLPVFIAAVIAVGLLCLGKMFLFTEWGTGFTPELDEKIRLGEMDINPQDLERLDRTLLKSDKPLYPILLERKEMSAAQRKKMIQDAVDKQLLPYIMENRTFTIQQVDKLKKRNNFAMRVIKHGDNLTIVQTEQEKDNWAYWYRMDQTAIALKAMQRIGMLPHRFDLVVNLNDEPNMSQRDFTLGLPPLFSYCSTPRNYDLLWVGWQYWRCLSTRHWEDFMAEPDCPKPFNITEAVHNHPWKTRIPQALWRGSPTGRRHTESNWRVKPRPLLAMISQDNPDVLNCTLSKCQEGQCTEEAVEQMQQVVGFQDKMLKTKDYLRHKYLVDVDGNSYSSRFALLLSTGALVFKQDTHYEEFLDLFFQPDRHYVRVEKDFSNLVGEVKKAIREDRRAELMAARSVALMQYIVEKDIVFEYLQTLIEAYAKLLVWDD